MMNKFFIGFQKEISDFLPKGKFLFLHDEIPEIPDKRRPALFDPHEASFNPLLNLDYHYATYLVEVLSAVFPAGTNTLTKETALDFILQALLHSPQSFETLIPRPDKNASPGHIWAYNKINRLLASPVLQRVLDPEANQFQFASRVVLARLSRAELGDFDALFLGLLLVGHFKGQLVIPDFGFYGRDAHISLIRQNRLVAGVNFLDELPLRLRQAVLSIQEKVPIGALYSDAKTLAEYAGLRPDPLRKDNPYEDFIKDAMEY
jgi:hypothetical protein